MRPLVLALALVVPLSSAACKKSDSAASAEGGAASESSGSSGAALGAGFEGDITMHVTSEKAPPLDLQFHIKGNKGRVDVPTHNNETAHVVFDSAAQKTLVVLDAQHMYMEVDHDLALKAPGPHPTAAQITPTGKHETVAGADCEDWDIVETLGKRSTACIAEGIAFFDFSPTRPTGMLPARTWMDELRLKRAFPLKAVETDSAGQEISRMVVTKIDKRSLDDSLFAIPAGYKAMPTFHPGSFPMPMAPKPR